MTGASAFEILIFTLSALFFVSALAIHSLVVLEMSRLRSRMLGEIAIVQEDTLRIVEDVRDIRSDMRRLIPTGASGAEVASC